MTWSRRQFCALASSAPLAWLSAAKARALGRAPLVIARGGATPDSPEGTRGAYELAIKDGADFIAAQFVPTRDGVLVARPDHELSASTDIALRPGFADRRRSLLVEGRERSGWFTEDFTLAELKTLSCAPAPRRRARAGDGAGLAVLTFEEIVTIARAGSVKMGRVVGVLAEMSQPAYFAGLDLAIEPRLAGAIRVAGYDAAAAAMLVAGADAGALKTIGDLTRARRVLRILPAAGAMSPDIASIRSQAEIVAVDPALAIDLAAPKLPPAPLVAAAHAAGLGVQVWTTGSFPPPPYRPGDTRRLLAALFAAGADAVAGDLAAPIARARADAVPETRG